MSDEIKDVETQDTPVDEVTEVSLKPEAETDIASGEDVKSEEKPTDTFIDDADDDDDDEELIGKNGKKKKKPLTRAQRKKRKITALIATGAVVLVLAIFFGSIAIANPIGVKALLKQAENYTPVEYTDQLVPEIDGDGYWTFETDDDLKVLQFTDVHIGGGCFSQTKDMWAMNAVATMIRAEKPDLVVVTGDIAYPVPFQAGTFNNLSGAKIFANMMESLGVYWTFVFGNHDTEAYSMYTREDICKYYEEEIGSGRFKHCLFQRGFASEERGYGNTLIKVKNTSGITTQALVMLDSHSYIDGDYFGMAWKYDSIHESQVDWYVGEMQKLVAANVANGGTDTPVKNLAFFHIPLEEYREAWSEIFEKYDGNNDNLVPGETKTEHVEYLYGKMGESDGKKNGQRTYGVFCGLYGSSFFERGVENGLTGTYSGHDHYNNFSVLYTKEYTNSKGETVQGEVRLTYGMSVDYLAYPGIYKEHLQRGCTVITVRPDGSSENTPKNYYSDYNVQHEKD